MKKLRIVQIGWLHDHALPTLTALKQLSDQFDLLGLVPYDPGFENAPGLFRTVPTLTLDEVLAMDDLDGVIIETEENSSTAVATLFAKKGVAVHLDKPGAQDEAAFETMIDTFKRTGAALQMGYMYRFNPVVRQLIADCQAHKYGQVFSVEAQMSVRHPDEKRQWLARFRGGMTFFLGCHLIDLILQIKGLPERIIPLNKCTGINGCTAEDYGFAVLEYPDGVSFIKTTATEVNGFERRQLVISAEKGTFEVKPLEKHNYAWDSALNTTGLRQTLWAEGQNPWYDASAYTECPPYDRYVPMMREFYEIALGEKDNPYSLDYELSLFKTILRACGM